MEHYSTKPKPLTPAQRAKRDEKTARRKAEREANPRPPMPENTNTVQDALNSIWGALGHIADYQQRQGQVNQSKLNRRALRRRAGIDLATLYPTIEQ